MIKKYNQYIKENIHSDIDPYGEENWDDENLSPILQIAKNTGKPYDQITVLDCNCKQLTSLEGIEKLINLEYLYCGVNQLTSLAGIENLTNLNYLYCDHNQLRSLDEIKNLNNLEIIFCRKNQFSIEYKEYLKEYCKKKKIKIYNHD